MNAIEVYKKLPKKNCGECRQEKCMPFALSLIKSEAELHECPYLSEDEVRELKKTIVHSDWREELILRLKEEIKGIDLNEVATYIGAEVMDNALMLRCMGREFVVDAGGEITSKGIMTPWLKILLLHYIKTSGRAELSRKWVSFSQLKSGMVKSSSFTRDCEEPLRGMFDHGFENVVSILKRFGAETRADFPTEHAWHMRLLPKIPVVILYWPADAEFASKVTVLFDSTADKFLDVESIMFLVEGLIYNVEAALSRPVR
jgi:hypothetical protein